MIMSEDQGRDQQVEILKMLKDQFRINMLFLVLITLLGVFVFISHYDLQAQQDPSHLNSARISTMIQIMQYYSQGHEYVNNVSGEPDFNCVNYSQGLYDILNELGYQPELVVGRDLNNTKAHMWVRVRWDIEPITGQFVNNYDEIYPNQTIEGR